MIFGLGSRYGFPAPVKYESRAVILTDGFARLPREVKEALLAQPSDQNKRDPLRGGLFCFSADGFPNVRYWHLADIGLCAAHVWFRE